jgi:cell division protein FtsW
MFLLVGILVVVGVHAIKPKYFIVLGLSLPVACGLLIATRLLGNPVNGSYRWIDIGGVSFQPSELAKLCLVAFTAYVLSKRKDNTNDRTFHWILGATALTCGIIFIDNGSTAIILGIAVFLMMVVGQIPLKKLLILGLILGVVGGGLFCVFRYVSVETLHKLLPRSDTWVERFHDFGEKVDVREDNFVINDDNYQVSHSNIAIANGRLLGKIPGRSSERHFLPQAYSDFIYAIIIEETGLLGGIVVLLLYIYLFIRAGIIAHQTNRLFSKFMVMGASMLLLIQALANMAVTVNLIPVTGQTLPLISRGGTSTLITCVYFGIILSVSRYENPKGMKKEQEIEDKFMAAKMNAAVEDEDLQSSEE